MRDAARCFIHIGAPKTGSTLLQKVLFENREAIEHAGILYPDVSLRGYGHHDLAFLISGGYPSWATGQPRSLHELGNDLRNVIAGRRESLLFSSEDFYLCPNPEHLKEFLSSAGAFDGRKPSIIVYVRRQDDAHESWYNQTIKAQGYTHDVETCIKEFHDLWDYQKQLDRWASVFGQDALVVRCFDPEEFVEGSLLADLLSVVGLKDVNVNVPEDRINTSLNADVLEFQRLLNHLPLPEHRKRRFHRQLMELSAQTTGEGLFDESWSIGPERRATLLASYQKGNAEVASRYLGRDRLFKEPSPTVPRGLPATKGLTPEKLAMIVGWLLLKEQ
jgi:hypothetical protein